MGRLRGVNAKNISHVDGKDGLLDEVAQHILDGIAPLRPPETFAKTYTRSLTYPAPAH